MLSYRRLAVLIDNAPPGSAYLRSVHGELGLWTRTDYILADLIDLTHACHDKDGRCRRPYPRPKAAKPDVKKLGGDNVISLDAARQVFPFRKE